MKTLLITLLTLISTTLFSQNLSYAEGYKFDVESGFYYSEENLEDLIVVNHRDSLLDYPMEWQPDSVLLTSLMIRDDNNLGQVVAFAAECGIEVQSLASNSENMVVAIGETDCNYEFRRFEEDPIPLSLPSEDFTGIYVFLDGPDRDESAALITSENTLQRATSTDEYILLTGHTRDTLGFLDIDSVYTPIELQHEDSGYIIAIDQDGKMAWHYENESETQLSFIRTAAYIDNKAYIAHNQVFKTDILVLSEEGELLEEYSWDGVSVYNITSDEENNIYISGHYNDDLGNGNISFSSQEVLLPEPESLDAFIAKYDSDLNYLWSQTITGENIDTGVHCDVDDNGDIFLTGCIQRNGVFDKGGPNEVTFDASGLEDVFLAKYSSAGQLLYANTLGGTSSDIGLRVIAEDDEVKLWGLFRNTIDLSLDDDISYLFADENDTVDESYFFVVYDDFTITDTEEVQDENATLSLYPNPVNDLLYVKLTDRSKYAYATILDVTGRSVGSYTQVPSEVNVSSLNAGIYTLHIYNDNGAVHSERFMVSR